MARVDALAATTGPFAGLLRGHVGRAWDLYIDHAFFGAIADGTLARERFTFWLEQDLPYVEEYSRARSVLAQRVAADSRFDDLAGAVSADEWNLYPGEQESAFELEMLKSIGWEPAPIGRFDARPAREAYINHVARAALEGCVGEVVCALLPCEWGFTEMGRRMSETRVADLSPVYARWIEYYTSPEQLRNTVLSLQLLERAAQVADEEERYQMKHIFHRSVQHQIAVLDAAWAAADPWPDERRTALPS